MLRVFNGLIELHLLAEIVFKQTPEWKCQETIKKFLTSSKSENYLRFKIMRKVTNQQKDLMVSERGMGEKKVKIWIKTKVFLLVNGDEISNM